MTALAGNFMGGWLSPRVQLGRLMAVSQSILAAGVFALPMVTTMTQVMLWAAAMGLGGGLVMVLFFSVWGRLFGRMHLGRIQGVAQALYEHISYDEHGSVRSASPRLNSLKSGMVLTPRRSGFPPPAPGG